jgi:hypothetical protein
VTEFVASEAIWAPDGTSVSILDKTNSQFCLLYDDEGREATIAPEGLTHVSEEEEWEEDGRPLGSLAEAKSLWEATRQPRAGLV